MVAILAVVFLFAMETHAFTPKVGYKKVVVRQAAPKKQKPPQFTAGLAAEVVYEYSESTTLYVSEEDLPEVKRRAAENNLELSVENNFDVLELPNGHIDVRKGTEASLPGKRLGPPAQGGAPGLYLIQFAGPVAPEWAAEVAAAGVMFIQYIPTNGYIVAATPDVMAAVKKLPYLQFLDVFHASLKSQAVPRTPGKRSTLLISIANVSDKDKTLKNLERMSDSELVTEILGEDREEFRVRGSFDGSDVEDIVNERLVFAVSMSPHGSPSDERVAMALGSYLDSQGGVLTQGGLYKAWLEGICPACATLKNDGFYVGVSDIGFWRGPQNASGQNDPGPADLPNDHGVSSPGRVAYGTDFMLGTTAHTPTTFDDPSSGGHGTFVSSVIAGNPSSGADPSGFLYGMGVAPSAGVLFTKMKYGEDLTPVFDLAHDARSGAGSRPVAYIQNHSWNDYRGENPECVPRDGRYTIGSHDYDRAVRDSNNDTSDGATPILLVVSAGNQFQSAFNENCNPPFHPRSLTSPVATAKNVLSVGGTELPRASTEQWNCRFTAAGADGLNNVEFDSKRGTADAGWFKPDLMAPAANVAGLRLTGAFELANCDGTTDVLNPQQHNVSADYPAVPYMSGCGTSFAAPVGSAAALLASRAYSAMPGAARPSLLKAMLVMSAQSMKGGKDKGDRDGTGAAITPIPTIGALPNKRQGFGRINLERILDPYPARAYVNEAQTLAGVNSTWPNTYRVHDATKPVIVVLTWTDVEGQISNDDFLTNPIVNDLDLAVFPGTTCSGNRYVGNSVSESTEESLAVSCMDGSSFDRKNNIEYVRFYGMAAGSDFSVVVKYFTGTGTASGGNQTFSLAVWNAYDADDPAPPAAPTGLNAVATSSTAVSVTWNTVSGASYDVRMWDGGPFWKTVSTAQAGTSYARTGLTPMTTYLFAVRARNATGVSPQSSADGATTFASGNSALFTDDPLVAGTTIVKAVHVVELRQAVNAFRASAGIGAMAYTDPTLSVGATQVLVAHVQELRNGLDAARLAFNLPALSYTNPTLTGQVVKASHLQELRNAVK